MESNAALLRVASLSVEEISRGDFGADRLRESFIRQAIGLAAGHDLLNGSSQRIEEAIARYVTRMGGRATPFGLLAGTAFVNTGTTRRLELSDRCSHQAFIRIDMAVLELLVAAYCPSASTTLLRPGEEPLALALSALRQAGATPQAEALHELASSVCGPRPVAQISMARLEAAWHAAAATLPELAGIHEKKRFHVDLDLLLAADQVEERLAENLDLTLRRLQLLFHSSDPLQEFREEFRSRFEDGEVPLDEVLNFKQGLMEKSVTITSPLADRAGVERRRKPTSELTVPDISIAAYDHWRSTGRPYDLADQPVAQHGVARSVQAALIGSQAEGHDAVLVSGQERSPLASLARFALSRPDREAVLRGWLASREYGPENPIVAELVHTSKGRVGNILLRPRLHRWSMGLGRQSGATLQPEHLLVSLAGDQFVLRHAPTGRPVLLELNSAHSVDFPGNDPRYRLLANMSGVAGIGWRWGGLTRMSHLPRVTCGRIIVQPERWRLGTDEVNRVLGSSSPAHALQTLLPGLEDRRWVGCGTKDRLIPVDLHSSRAVSALIGRAARTGAVDLTELPHVEHPAVASAQGHHVAEVCFPLSTMGKRASISPQGHAPRVSGASWVYFSYFCSVLTADEVILQARECTDRLREDGRASAWFFIRYGKGGNHVRVRLRPSGDGHRADVVAELDALGRRLMSSGLVTRVTTDQYIPEVARFGGSQGLASAEELFTVDSDRVCDFLAQRPTEEQRLFRGIADLLQWSETFFSEYAETERLIGILRRRGDPSKAGRQLGSRYGEFFREQRKNLDDYLANSKTCVHTHAALREVRDTPPPPWIAETSDHGGKEEAFRAIMHLHFNRLFTVDIQRLERLAYDLGVRKILERHARVKQQEESYRTRTD
ncbi:lantibiotic dehydratase [Streptomyces canus]|uniref:lantibiotic dehydratase n=1 Tax=Streptomyces canus TaxID=58343 RepID=UPI0038643A51|nr:lantibiotic dehydratase [Streptomyces canus]